MSLSKEAMAGLAELSLNGEFQRRSIDQFCRQYPELTETEAYEIQTLRIKRLEERGFRTIGYKLGGTSLAKQKQMSSTIYAEGGAAVKVSSVVYGRLMDYMLLPSDADLQFEELLHPKVEPELAFIMGAELKGRFVTAPDVMNATRWLAPAFEIIDSRFHDFKIGSRYDAIADNTSSARFKLGEQRRSPRELNPADIGMSLMRNGEYVGFGAGAAVMGHPARAVAELVCALSRVGLGLKEGDIVLSGAITPSTPAKPGDRFQADFGGLGRVELSILPEA